MSNSLEIQLRACGFKSHEIAEPEGMPEQLVLAACAEPGISIRELMQERWYQQQPRRFELAFERLKRTGRINFGHGFGEVWIVAEAIEKRKAMEAAIAKHAAPPAATKPVQRSLF